MLRLIATLGLVYALAFFFWFRFLYFRSLRTAAKRNSFWISLERILPFIPLGLHAAFLLIYAVLQFRAVHIGFSELIARYVFGKKEVDKPGFYPLKIIVVASLLIVCYDLLLRSCRAVTDKATALLLQLLLFAGGCYSLKLLVLNIKLSAGLPVTAAVPFRYENTWIWVAGLLFTFFAALPGGESTGADSGFKYPALVSRIVWLYCLIAMLFSIPRALFLVL